MTAWDRILSGGLWCAGLGALLLSVLALLWWAVFAPDGQKDGQFVLIFYLFTIPFGALLGAAAGVARVLLGLHARETAGWVCVAGGSLAAGLVAFNVVSLLGMKGWYILSHPSHGAPLLWASAEIIFGLSLLCTR
jgi:hypothetical protein